MTSHNSTELMSHQSLLPLSPSRLQQIQSLLTDNPTLKFVRTSSLNLATLLLKLDVPAQITHPCIEIVNSLLTPFPHLTKTSLEEEPNW